jgi:hypothetical protein
LSRREVEGFDHSLALPLLSYTFLRQIALHYLSSLPSPLSSFTELQLLSSKTFGRSERKCRRVRQLHRTPPSAHTHDTVFFALLDCDTLPEFHGGGGGGGGGEVALVAVDALLSSKAAGFAACEMPGSDGRPQVSGLAKCSSFSLREHAPHSFSSTVSASACVCGSSCRNPRARCVCPQRRFAATRRMPHLFCSGCFRTWPRQPGSRDTSVARMGDGRGAGNLMADASVQYSLFSCKRLR